MNVKELEKLAKQMEQSIPNRNNYYAVYNKIKKMIREIKKAELSSINGFTSSN